MLWDAAQFYHKVCFPQMAKLESCVGTSAGRRTGQSVRWATWSEVEMLGRILLMTDFRSDSIGTGEDTVLDLTGQADTAKDALELEIDCFCLARKPLRLLSWIRSQESIGVLVAPFGYTEARLSLVITTCQVLVYGNLAKEKVMADVLKDKAKNCVIRNKFMVELINFGRAGESPTCTMILKF